MSAPLNQDLSTRRLNSGFVSKQGFAHFMLEEIHEQPKVVQACLKSFLVEDMSLDNSAVALSQRPINLGLSAQVYSSINKIQSLASGSSLHASLVGKYLLEKLAKIPTIVHCAADFCDAPPPSSTNTLIVGVTQSGETTDTLDALEIERDRRCAQLHEGDRIFLGITNRSGSSLEKLAHHTIHTPAGVEVAIAATKTFIAQLVTFYCLALDMAYCRQTLSAEQLAQILAGLQQLPAQMELILQTQKQHIEELARSLTNTQSSILLGRGINFPIALEGALKLKETTYMHAEGYQAGEFLHGPIAMLDSQVAAIAIAIPGAVCEKVLANAQKVKAAGARLIGITSIKNPDLLAIFDELIPLPEVDELLSPILSVIPLQLLAYYLAVHRGLDVDRPRNLTKAVTVR